MQSRKPGASNKWSAPHLYRKQWTAFRSTDLKLWKNKWKLSFINRHCLLLFAQRGGETLFVGPVLLSPASLGPPVFFTLSRGVGRGLKRRIGWRLIASSILCLLSCVETFTGKMSETNDSFLNNAEVGILPLLSPSVAPFTSAPSQLFIIAK